MKLAAKIKSAASDSAMLSAYARWVGAKVFSGKSPRLSLPGGGQIGGWLSFSEYWSFVNIMPEPLVPAPERLLIERRLAKKSSGQVAFDVGANVGVFTCMIAGMGAHHVHAFEPIPETFCRLKGNVAANGLLGRCHLNWLAVGGGMW
jgi:hypothetical protein